MTYVFAALISVLTANLALASEQELELKTIELEKCVMDQPFQEELIALSNAYGTNGYQWYRAGYEHYYMEVRKILIIAANASGNVYERQVITRTPMKHSFLFQADYYERERANNHETQIRILKATLARFLLGRQYMQCPSNA